ncbi:hypothetical protein TYRP_008227 [Tyrophagus putrescentiae]|nr:hypothetical protein TYRP_008227 [Tyrophagus putrescentiae]
MNQLPPPQLGLDCGILWDHQPGEPETICSETRRSCTSRIPKEGSCSDTAVHLGFLKGSGVTSPSVAIFHFVVFLRAQSQSKSQPRAAAAPRPPLVTLILISCLGHCVSSMSLSS